MGRTIRGLLVATVLAFTFARCGGSGGGSSPPTTPSTQTPTVTAVTVIGPSSTAKAGDSSQFTATATLSNSTSQTVTNQATWQSSNAAVATVSSTGFATAVGAGDVDIKATYQNVSGSAHVTVTAPAPPVPTTFSVCGTVKEDTGSATISGATVIVKDTSISTSSDAAGHYCTTGLGTGKITLRATHSGYDLAEQDVIVSGNMTADIAMHKQSSTPSPSPSPSPAPTPGPNGPTCNAAAYPATAPCGTPSAVCNDGSLSCSGNRSGTCSGHTGVMCWLCPGALCSGFDLVESYTPAVGGYSHMNGPGR